MPAVEIQPQQPGQTDVVTEFIITDQDVEQALHQQPTTHIDSITLREEMPLRTVARDEDVIITLNTNFFFVRILISRISSEMKGLHCKNGWSSNEAGISN